MEWKRRRESGSSDPAKGISQQKLFVGDKETTSFGVAQCL